ncbi:MAG: arginine--tRNA ligase, partial [Acidobacteria bacterium]
MIDLFGEVRAGVEAAVRRACPAAPPEVPVEFPPDPSLGDLATPVAFGLARILKRPPRAIAEELAREIAALPGVAAAEAAGPGFVNVRLDRDAGLARLLAPPG